MLKHKNFFLFILSAILLIPAWFEWGHGLFSLFALVPLLIAENNISKDGKGKKGIRIWVLSLLTFFIWNAATTWWIYYATAVGVIVAFVVNSILMSAVIVLFHHTKRKLGYGIGYFALLLYWLTFEHFYFNAEISWPWLTLGHAFNYNTRFIQWYDSTGVLGGSLWIVLSNILLFSLFQLFKKERLSHIFIKTTVLFTLVIIAPIIISFIKYYTYKEKKNPHSVIVLQPNIDPYEKFIAMDKLQQTMIQLKLAGELIDSTTDYIIGPETSLNNNIWLEDISGVYDVVLIKKLLDYYPKAKYVVGAQCYRVVAGGDTLNQGARKFPGTELYYESFNAAIQIDTSSFVPYYFKSRLVVGVEKMPYAKFFSFMDDLIIELGGTMRGWTTQKERDVFVSPQDSIKIAPVICWESVFGEYVTDYIKKGANYIFVITNDGWWGDTPGYKQHNALSRLRAIETRRSIARSANTGISCFIDQRGDILEKRGWWIESAIKGTINANSKLTFYVKNGDYIGRIARFFSLLIFIMFLVRFFYKRKQSNE